MHSKWQLRLLIHDVHCFNYVMFSFTICFSYLNKLKRVLYLPFIIIIKIFIQLSFCFQMNAVIDMSNPAAIPLPVRLQVGLNLQLEWKTLCNVIWHIKNLLVYSASYILLLRGIPSFIVTLYWILCCCSNIVFFVEAIIYIWGLLTS